jgi:hypothetical protein
MKLTLRSIVVSSLLATAALSAHANLTIPINFTVSNSVQKFPSDVLSLMGLAYINIEARGTATAIGNIVNGTDGAPAIHDTYNMPVTKIVIGNKLNIASGSAVGSALVFSRYDIDTGERYLALTLANFTIDYVRKQVLADVTPLGGTTNKQQAIYNFSVATPLALKYRFPVSVTGHEVLNKLYLTPETKAAYTQALELQVFETPTLDMDFGTLTQDISLKLRSRPINATPYVAN